MKEADELLSQGTNVFVYEWSYVSKRAMRNYPWRGAVHSSEIHYLFDKPEASPPEWQSTAELLTYPEEVENDEDQTMKRILADLWTNFAKFGQVFCSFLCSYSLK